MTPTAYAVLGVPRPRAFIVLSRHDDSGRAFTAYRAAAPPVALVRLDDGRHLCMDAGRVTVLAAKGVGADALQDDPEFRQTAKDALRE